MVVDLVAWNVGRDRHRVAQTVDDPCAVVVLNGLRAVASGTVDDVECTGVGQLMRFGLLPRVGVVKIFLHGMHGDGHHVGALFTGLFGFGYGFVDVGLMVRIAALAQTVDAPIIIGGLRVQGHGTGDQAQFAATGRGIDDQRFGRVFLGLVGARLGDAVLVEGIPQACDAIRALIPRMVRRMRACAIPHLGGRVGDLRGNVEHRIPGVGATARRDRRFEFAHRDIGGIDVLAHRFEQTGEVIGRTVRRRGIGTGEVVPQTRVEQQIAIDHHGDAIGIRTVRRIAVMFLWLGLFHHMLFLLGHVHLRCGPLPGLGL